MRPPTPLAERASTPDQPEASPVATEVVKTVATATTIEAAKIASVSTPEIGTSAAKPAPWVEHVSVVCRVLILVMFVYNLCWFHYACNPFTSTWLNQAKLLSRLNKRGTTYALPWSNLTVSVFDFFMPLLCRL